MNAQAKKDEFIKLIAAMTKTGENDFIMENDDAVSTLNELIESARELIAEQPKTYTVVLLYPDGDSTYTEAAQAETASEAAKLVQQMASTANGGDYSPDEFTVVVVFEGDLTPEISMSV